MTVKELREILKKFDPDKEVIVETCYEPNLSPIGDVRLFDNKMFKEWCGKVFISSNS